MGLSIPNFIIGFKDNRKGIDKNNFMRRKLQMDIVSKLLFAEALLYMRKCTVVV